MMTLTTPAAVDAPPARRSLRVIVADPDPAARAGYQSALTALDHQVCLADSGRQVVELCRAVAPDVVIAAATLPDADGFALAAVLCAERPVPVVLAFDGPDVAAVWADAGGHVVGYLVKPLRADTIEASLAAAVACFERVKAAGEEADRLRRELEDRKVIERAKGALSHRGGLHEADAYDRLRPRACNYNRKLADVAREVLAAEDVFRGLEAAGGTYAVNGNSRG